MYHENKRTSNPPQRALPESGLLLIPPHTGPYSGSLWPPTLPYTSSPLQCKSRSGDQELSSKFHFWLSLCELIGKCACLEISQKLDEENSSIVSKCSIFFTALLYYHLVKKEL